MSQTSDAEIARFREIKRDAHACLDSMRLLAACAVDLRNKQHQEFAAARDLMLEVDEGYRFGRIT